MNAQAVQVDSCARLCKRGSSSQKLIWSVSDHGKLGRKQALGHEVLQLLSICMAHQVMNQVSINIRFQHQYGKNFQHGIQEECRGYAGPCSSLCVVVSLSWPVAEVTSCRRLTLVYHTPLSFPPFLGKEGGREAEGGRESDQKDVGGSLTIWSS